MESTIFKDMLEMVCTPRQMQELIRWKMFQKCDFYDGSLSIDCVEILTVPANYYKAKSKKQKSKRGV